MPRGRFHTDQSGRKIHKLTLLKMLNERTGNSSFKYLTKCECGTEKVIGYSLMTSGRTKSCGCSQYPKGKDSPNYKHGLSQERHTLRYKKYQRECYDKHKYNLLPEEKQSMVKAQKNSCAICGYKFGQKSGDMHVDHNHETGKVRGLLCDLCNRGLGYFKDNKQSLANAIKYLNKE